MTVAVASFTDAWIETLQSGIDKRVTESHLLQMRGLKRMHVDLVVPLSSVASFTDAWIETLFEQCAQQLYRSHLLQMRGLKPLFKGAFERVFNVASFTGTTFIIFFARRLQD